MAVSSESAPPARKALLRERAQRLLGFGNRHARLFAGVGLVLSVWVALATTAQWVPVSRTWIDTKLSTPNEDIRNIYLASSHARWRDIPHWFVGPWIYPGIGYYRPITSLLYFGEYRLFADDFTAYNRVTWILHGLNVGLVYLLVVSLFRDRRLLRALLGLIAVLYFTTSSNSMFIGVIFSIGWWPAQNDVLSLTFGLLTLLLLDQYLVVRGRLWLSASLTALCLCIGSKEMGYAAVPAAIALVWHRRHKPVREMALFGGVGLFFYVLRKLVVPNPWAQNYFTAFVARKVMLYAGGVPGLLVKSGVWWPVLAATLIIAFVTIGLRKRWPAICVLLVCLLSTALCAQFSSADGTWALLLEGEGSTHVAHSLIYFSAFILFWRYRRVEPGWFSSLAVASVFVPILQFVGYHYMYWPGAFLALADACYCACLLRFAREVIANGNWSIALQKPHEVGRASLVPTPDD